MPGVKCVSRHEEASSGGGSFAPQGSLTARQNLAVCVSRTTCLAISTNLSSGWFYQDHRWSVLNEYVVLIKRIFGPTWATVLIVRLSVYSFDPPHPPWVNKSNSSQPAITKTPPTAPLTTSADSAAPQRLTPHPARAVVRGCRAAASSASGQLVAVISPAGRHFWNRGVVQS